ncbi:DNA primase, partial [bacterium]|nr:DNA primase [candidate division CSSED10-310 bacterium]
MYRIPDQVLDELRRKVDILGIISEHVKLRRSGRSFKGLCPFHSEKTPSFFVHPDKQMFYCFGCGKGGDAIKYVMLRDGLRYVEAVKLLAHSVGMEIETRPETEEETRQRDERELMMEAHQQSLDFFTASLRSHPEAPIWRYLQARKLSPAIIEQFQIGYAPPGNLLSRHLIKLGFQASLLARAGLVQLYEQGAGDRFRDRMMLPIHNPFGQVVGFGGRLLDDGQPKYLNSPETPLFQKGHLLFGLNLAKKAIHTQEHAILVEGYMDVVALVQAGIANVIAPLGTALTSDQIHLLRRYTSTVHLLFDGDNAGRQAAMRSVELLLKEDYPEVRVIVLPIGKDPDDMVRDAGQEGIRHFLDEALPAIDFIIRIVSERRPATDPDARIRNLADIIPYLALLRSTARRSAYIGHVAARLGIPEQAVFDELRRHR